MHASPSASESSRVSLFSLWWGWGMRRNGHGYACLQSLLKGGARWWMGGTRGGNGGKKLFGVAGDLGFVVRVRCRSENRESKARSHFLVGAPLGTGENRRNGVPSRPIPWTVGFVGETRRRHGGMRRNPTARALPSCLPFLSVTPRRYKYLYPT